MHLIQFILTESNRIEPIFLQKNTKIIKNLSTVRRDELVFNSVRLNTANALNSIVSLY